MLEVLFDIPTLKKLYPELNRCFGFTYDDISNELTQVYAQKVFNLTQEEKELAEHDLMLWGKQNSPFSNAINGVQKGSSFKGAMASSKGWSKNNRVTYMESHDEERVAYNASVNGIGEIRGTYEKMWNCRSLFIYDARSQDDVGIWRNGIRHLYSVKRRFGRT